MQEIGHDPGVLAGRRILLRNTADAENLGVGREIGRAMHNEVRLQHEQVRAMCKKGS